MIKLLGHLIIKGMTTQFELFMEFGLPSVTVVDCIEIIFGLRKRSEWSALVCLDFLLYAKQPLCLVTTGVRLSAPFVLKIIEYLYNFLANIITWLTPPLGFLVWFETRACFLNDFSRVVQGETQTAFKVSILGKSFQALFQSSELRLMEIEIVLRHPSNRILNVRIEDHSTPPPLLKGQISSDNLLAAIRIVYDSLWMHLTSIYVKGISNCQKVIESLLRLSTALPVQCTTFDSCLKLIYPMKYRFIYLNEFPVVDLLNRRKTINKI
uniref:Uncharacterized protein n=1 Tax=Glossina palpalis gambiensis TaxID=67801 RepID=A0A1B0BVS6_9MUSC